MCPHVGDDEAPNRSSYGVPTAAAPAQVTVAPSPIDQTTRSRRAVADTVTPPPEAERVIGPDACIALDFMLDRFVSIVEGMEVDPGRMLENLESSRGLIYSGTLLIALADSGVSREEAYHMVQNHALAAWEGGAGFKERVLADPEIVSRVPRAKLEEAFELKRHFRHVDTIFKRAFR